VTMEYVEMTITRYARRSPFVSPWLEVENNVLTLSGEKREKKEEGDDRRYHLWERRYSSFKRTFNLPRTVNTEAISAHMNDGVLLVHMPKAPEAKSRKIDIEA